jgi:hypothetical protein
MNRSEFQTYAEGCHGSITARSLATGNHYTFKFRQSRGGALLASILTDGDQWLYLGVVDFPRRALRLTPKSNFSDASQSYLALRWLIQLAEFNPAVVEVLHDGRCGRCGRPLTHPDSIQSGIGPICAQRP